MDVRSKLSYANVVATLALFLVLAGGTVYAAVKLGKNDVKSKHIARGAVGTSDLKKGAVTSKKVKDGSINGADLAAGVFAGLDVDVTAAARFGAKGGLTTATLSPLPLTGTTSFTPGAGEVAAIAAEGEFTIATTDPTKICNPAVFLSLDGEPTRVFVDPVSEGTNTTLETSLGRDADGPFGLLDPGEPLEITAEIRGDVDCTADTQLDRLEIKVLQIR